MQSSATGTKEQISSPDDDTVAAAPAAIPRVPEANRLRTIISEVVETAGATLVIGP